MMQTWHVIGLLGLSMGIGAGAGCWGPASSHCGNLSGDQTCAERGAGAFCNICLVEADGCTNAKPAEGCYFPGVGGAPETSSTHGGNVSTGTEGNTSGGDSSSTSGSSTSGSSTSGGSTSESSTSGTTNEGMTTGTTFESSTGSGTTTGPGTMCDEHDDCTDPMQSVCEDGSCVECTSEMSDACAYPKPMCDDVSNTCFGCSEHEQCGEAACNFFTGACLPVDVVVHVGPGLETLDNALDSLAMLPEATIILHEDDYQEAVTVDGGMVRAFLAANGERPTWDNGGGAPQLSVVNGVVLLDNLELSERGGGPAIVVNGGSARAWVDRSRIINNRSGILATNDAEVVLRNCFVGESSADMGYDYALRVTDGATSTVLYSTLTARSSNAAALSCNDLGVVVVRNSIIVAEGDPMDPKGAVDIDCGGASIDYSATESTVMGGLGNASVGEMGAPSSWFAGYGVGNFHLYNTGLGVFAAVAQWQTDDPLTDIDGDLRIAVDGTMDHAGADRP